MRTDTHRPSVINPEDYSFVAYGYQRVDGIADIAFMQQQRAARDEHMRRTGGTWSQHDHGGSCHICGANAIYTVIFYHASTNSYIFTGTECADKLGHDDADAFRRHMSDARKNAAGKAKAKLILADENIEGAWAIYEAHSHKIIADIVDRLVKYGDISERQIALVRKIMDGMTQRIAERETAAPVPVGRVTIVGKILSFKVVPSQFGEITKMLVQHETGWKVYGTKPARIKQGVGEVVTFDATIEPARDDNKFGFYSRPSKVR